MQLELSTRATALLVSRLLKKQSPVADAVAKLEPKVKRLFVRSVKTTRAALPMRELESVLALGHTGTGAPLYVVQDALRLWERELLGDGVAPAPVDWIKMRAAAKSKLDLPTILHDGLTAGAKAVTFVMNFDSANPEAIAWAEAHAAELVTAITLEAEAAIRTVIIEAFTLGVVPSETAKLIRASIGLTERDMGAVMRQLTKDFADGMSADRAVVRAERYADKLLRTRAKTISRTELMKASNEGQLQLWRRAREKGLLDATAKKVWIVYDPCPICLELSGEEAPIDGTFSNGLEGPPAHPNCRCSVGLV